VLNSALALPGPDALDVVAAAFAPPPPAAVAPGQVDPTSVATANPLDVLAAGGEPADVLFAASPVATRPGRPEDVRPGGEGPTAPSGRSRARDVASRPAAPDAIDTAFAGGAPAPGAPDLGSLTGLWDARSQVNPLDLLAAGDAATSPLEQLSARADGIRTAAAEVSDALADPLAPPATKRD
jgi:hypothetical protein